MLFNKYNLVKNHGEFVHLNMLKWALKQVPEVGSKTVPASETVENVEIGTGGVDIKSTVDATGEIKSRHVPYTDVQLNGSSQPTLNYSIHANGDAAYASGTHGSMIFDRYTKVIDPDGIGITDPNQQLTNLKQGVSFYDKDTIKVDGQDHKYITKLKYLNKDNAGTLTDANQDKEFKPYTSVIRDDEGLASKVKIEHDSDNHLTGVSFPATGESYDVEVTKATLFNMVYPVGSIYMSANDVNPGALFGGTWERIKDKFLLSAGTGHELGTEGGSESHTLTMQEIPDYRIGQIPAIVPGAHTNWNNSGIRGTTVGQASDTKKGITSTPANSISAGDQYGWSVNTNGGGQAFSTMPPYLTVNMWKRTA